MNSSIKTRIFTTLILTKGVVDGSALIHFP